MASLIQDFEADFPQKISLKILNSVIILKTLTHALWISREEDKDQESKQSSTIPDLEHQLGV